MNREAYKHFIDDKAKQVLTILRKGECYITALNTMCDIDDIAFRDVIAVLVEQKLIELHTNDGIAKITNTGRVYVLDNVEDIPFVGLGVDRTYKPNDIVHSEINLHHHFRLKLTRSQERALGVEIKDLNISSTPKQLLSFLKGNNNAKFKLTHLHHMAHLLSRLKEMKYLEFIGGKGYYKHFDLILSLNSRKVGKSSMKELNRQVKNPKYNKMQVSIDIDKIINRIISA